MPPPPLNRRQFLHNATAVSLGLAVTSQLSSRAAAAEPSEDFRSGWDNLPDQVWLGGQFWANPLQDWRVAGGRIECVKAATGRNVHILTRELTGVKGTLNMSVCLGLVDKATLAEGKGAAGFLVGVRGPLGDYRNNLMEANSGLRIGLRASGELFIGDGPKGVKAPVDLTGASLELRLEARPSGDLYQVKLTAHDLNGYRLVGSVERSDVPADFLVGNLALGANFGAPQAAAAKKAANNTTGPGADRWWFGGWQISGTKVASHPGRTFGPIFFTSHTLHGATLKLTAQLPPVSETACASATLSFEGRSETFESPLHPLARTAGFRVPDWDSTRGVRYRVSCLVRGLDGSETEHSYAGTIRPDPVGREELNVADISCNAHYAFPNSAAAEAIGKLNPDLVAFTGDQYYESTGGYGVDGSTVENCCLDVLRKWLMHGWTWREVTRDRPSLSLPDDHDVYHGNLWGEDGAAAPGRTSAAESKGGYKFFAEFVNAVHRMQTSHHPDSPAKPGKQGIVGYFGPLTYGGVSFAVLADRQYKSGPDGKVPPTGSGRADHVKDPNFDPKTADVPGLELLGSPQMAFLRQWTLDWRGAEMKAVISQTLFTAMPTHHGGDGLLVADYDTNAWPQTPRNAAVREMRKAFAFHLAGDQHLPTVVHYGVEGHADSVAAFASPAINNLYPRWFKPKDAKDVLGHFTDSFGHPLTVLACANPREEFRKGVLEAETDKSSGFGLVRFNKKDRTVRVECWPLLADPLQPGTQFPGWPVTVKQLDNYAKKAAAYLPELTITGADRAVVHVIEDKSGETVYTLRLNGPSWKPFVFSAGSHTVRVSHPETGRVKELKSLLPSVDGNAAPLTVEI